VIGLGVLLIHLQYCFQLLEIYQTFKYTFLIRTVFIFLSYYRIKK